MKRIILCACIFILVVGLAACGSGADQTALQNEGGTDRSVQEKVDAPPGSVLVAYFSRARNIDQNDDIDATTSASINLRAGSYVGNTELLARWIQEDVGGDLTPIQVEEPYSADYDKTVERAKKEQAEKARPKLASHVENMADYDIVFLGFPNWWYDMPMAVYRFLDEYDLSGKTVIPFCTSGGSGFSDTLDTISQMQPNMKLKKGLEIRGDDAPESKESVSSWLQELGFSQSK